MKQYRKKDIKKGPRNRYKGLYFSKLVLELRSLSSSHEDDTDDDKNKMSDNNIEEPLQHCRSDGNHHHSELSSSMGDLDNGVQMMNLDSTRIINRSSDPISLFQRERLNRERVNSNPVESIGMRDLLQYGSHFTKEEVSNLEFQPYRDMRTTETRMEAKSFANLNCPPVMIFLWK